MKLQIDALYCTKWYKDESCYEVRKYNPVRTNRYADSNKCSTILLVVEWDDGIGGSTADCTVRTVRTERTRYTQPYMHIYIYINPHIYLAGKGTASGIVNQQVQKCYCWCVE